MKGRVCRFILLLLSILAVASASLSAATVEAASPDSSFMNVTSVAIGSVPMLPVPQLRVAAYNVLAQALAKSSYFPYTKGNTLKWKARFPLLQRTIDGLGADVICLSEVDEIDQWRAWLSSTGFDSLFQQKPTKKWGSLIAWRRGSFELQRVAACDFNDVAVAVQEGLLDPAKLSADEPRSPSHYARDGNGLVVALRPSSGSPFAAQLDGILVGATHLYWDPAAASVKAAQAAQFRLCLGEALAEAVAAGSPSSASPTGPDSLAAALSRWAVFVGGDMNSFPRSAPVQLLRRVPIPVSAGLASGSASGSGSGSGSAASAPSVSSWNRWGRTSPPGMEPPPPLAASPTAAPTAAASTPASASALASATPSATNAAAAGGAASEPVAAAGGAGAGSSSSSGGTSSASVPAADHHGAHHHAAAAAPGTLSPTLLHHWQPYGELSPAYAAWLHRLAQHCVDAMAEAAAATGAATAAEAPSPALVAAPAPGYATLLLRSAYGSFGRESALVSAAAAPSASAADVGDDESFEPPFTTMVASFRGCIDYIMYSAELVTRSSSPEAVADTGGAAAGAVAFSSVKLPPRVVDVLPLPSEEAITANGSVAMPNPTMPSDHAPVAAAFQFAL